MIKEVGEITIQDREMFLSELSDVFDEDRDMYSDRDEAGFFVTLHYSELSRVYRRRLDEVLGSIGYERDVSGNANPAILRSTHVHRDMIPGSKESLLINVSDTRPEFGLYRDISSQTPHTSVILEPGKVYHFNHYDNYHALRSSEAGVLHYIVRASVRSIL